MKQNAHKAEDLGEPGEGLAAPDMIYVTRPYLPALDELIPLLEQIWDNRILTNQGPFHQRFEERLAGFLEAEQVSLVCNGMLALNAAIAAAEIEGEVITTPYSFVATTHAIALAGLTPVFADVRPEDFMMDPQRIEVAMATYNSARYLAAQLDSIFALTGPTH